MPDAVPEPSTDTGERLPGGNVGGAWRVGDTVRRPTGPWSPAVHRLLGHLEGRLPGVPRFHGFDALGREVLDYLPGRVVDVDAEELTDAQLLEVARWTRLLHSATADFVDAGPWRLRAHPGADVIGHNDIAPYNVCFDGERLVGVFDWDLAGPTTVLLELGWAAWHCVPLFRTPAVPVPDPDRWSAARLRLLAEGYGGVDPAAVLAATLTRMELAVQEMVRAAEAGDEGIRRLMETTGEPEPTRRALAQLRGRFDSISRHL